MLKIKKSLIVAAMLAAPLSVQATTQSWSFANNTSCIGTNCSIATNGTGQDGAAFTYTTSTTGTTNNVKVEGFSTTKDVGTLETANSSTDANDPSGQEDTDNANTTQDTFETATVQVYGSNGLAVSSREDGSTGEVPHHAFDNDGGITGLDETADGGDVDAGLFSFDNAITLNSISIGWKNTGTGENDADISILAYTGSSPTAPTIGSNSFTTLLSNGWSFVGHYADLNLGANTLNTGSVASKYWLISAYTSFANGSATDVASQSNNRASGSYGALDFGNDYFKIAGFVGETAANPTPSQVPEPASFVLLGLGLMGWRMTRRNAYVTVNNLA